MVDFLGRVNEFCFAASYVLALGLELFQLFQPRPILRLLALAAGAAGLFAHTVFVLFHAALLTTPFGVLLGLAWILAIFYLYGAIHHPRVGWGLFVLPVVLILVGLAELAPQADTRPAEAGWQVLGDRRFWPTLHGVLLLLAAVGVSVGFVASVMYLVQVWRLRAKLPPSRGLQLFSLERLEAMNRRAILLAFPLLTAGLLLGLALLLRDPDLATWESVKIFSTVGLWVVFAILLYLRYARHAGGRSLALWTIVAFGLLLFSLTSAHAFPPQEGQ